jgi:sterol 3beta-glucosyltransferase
MKIAILTTGSRGDMQPLAALGRKLVDEGHVVSLATVARYEPFVGSLGMRFSPVPGRCERVDAQRRTERCGECR